MVLLLAYMMARRPAVFPRLALLFLICSSCAWVGNGAAVEPVPVPVMGRRELVGGAGAAEPVWRLSLIHI